MAIIQKVNLNNEHIIDFSQSNFQQVIDAANNKIEVNEHQFHGFKIALEENEEIVSNEVQLYIHLLEKQINHYAMHQTTYDTNKDKLDKLNIVIFINDDYDEESDENLQKLLNNL